MKKVNNNNKLAFNSTAIVELNDTQMIEVDGGITPTTIVVVSSAGCAAAASSAGCAAVGGAIVGGIVAAIWA